MTTLALNYLQEEAARTIWCNPYQDMQAPIKPAKITAYPGSIQTVKILWRRHALPDNINYWHVYQIGQIHPVLLGLLDTDKRGWINLAEAMGQTNLMAEVFVVDGRYIPRSDCYYMWTAEKNLVLCVKEMTRIGIDLGTDPLYFRLYSNTFFATPFSGYGSSPDFISCYSQLARNPEVRAQLISTYNDKVASYGIAVRGYINGYAVKTISPTTLSVGDIAEILIDTSIKQILTYNVSDLHKFNSTLDNKYKYLLKSPSVGTDAAEIIFMDDLDVVVFDAAEPVNNRGVGYHRLRPDALRMVTHVDYAIPVAYLDDFINRVPAWTGSTVTAVRLYIRETGNTRKLPDEAGRIKELYKLPYEKCHRAMLGIDSVVPFWRAEALENSAYARLMGVPYGGITAGLVEQAYGYNAISKLVGNAPIKPLPQTTGTYPVPYLMRAASTAYEYDAAGLLMGSYLHINDAFYPARNAQARLVEFMYGRGGQESQYCVYGTTPVPINPESDFRCYICSVNEFGNSLNNWRDVTGTGSYLVENNVLTWTIDSQSQQGMVRLDSGFLGYTASIPMSTLGYMVHTLPGGDPKSVNKLQFVPHAQYDFWLNGHPLVEGIDYIQYGFNVVIFTKAYLVGDATQNQQLTVRGAGFCTPEFKRDKTGDTGFIKYAQLSKNAVFNVRDDKVMRISVGGALKTPEDFVFAENAVVFNNLSQFNGKPYQIRDMIVPFKKLVGANVYEMREAAIVRDSVVSDYMSLHLPEATPLNVNIINGLYPLYSPFMASIIHDYRDGTFNPPMLQGNYSDTEVMQACSDYEWLLAFDPTQDLNLVDPEYAIIHPHALANVVSVPVAFFTFLGNIARVYLRNRVILSQFVSITTA